MGAKAMDIETVHDALRCPQAARSAQRPCLRPGVDSRRIGPDTVIAEPAGRRHLLVDDTHLEIARSCDGRTDPAAIVDRFGRAALPFIDELRTNGFLVEADLPAERAVSVSAKGVEFARFGNFIGVVERAGFGNLTRWPIGVLATVTAAVGAALLRSGPNRHATALARPTVAVWCLVLASLAAGFVHEVAHALVIARHGRRVGAAGFGIYWGSLSFFVDSSDALLLDRTARIGQAAAGPLADLLTGGCLAIAASRLGPAPAGVPLHALAVVVMLSALLNVVPLLQLDGYWLLSDALGEPRLREEAFGALLHPGRWRSRHQGVLATYAAVSLLFGGALLVGAATVWLHELWPVAAAGYRSSRIGAAGAFVFVAPVAASLVLQLADPLIGRLRGARPATEGGEK